MNIFLLQTWLSGSHNRTTKSGLLVVRSGGEDETEETWEEIVQFDVIIV